MKLLSVPLIGRLGNLLFIYAHARAWAEQNGYELCLPHWVGEKIFAIAPALRPGQYAPDLFWPEKLYQDQGSLIYTRKQVKEWFAIKPDVLELLKALDKSQCPIVLNVREGKDYAGAGNVVLSRQCYADACRNKGYDPNQAHWETDANPTRLSEFEGDESGAGLGTTWVSMPSFYRLMTAPVLFRANSTFSWWAATLGNGKVFSPVIRDMKGGVPNEHCGNFVEGNWPAMGSANFCTDLHLKDE